MGCGSKRVRVSGSGHTDGTTTPIFSALTGDLSVNDYESARIAIEVQDLSNATDVEVARGVQYSNDGISWDAASAIGAYTSTEGWDYGAAYVSLNGAKRFARYGIMTRQTSGAGGSNNENVRVNLDIDLKPR